MGVQYKDISYNEKTGLVEESNVSEKAQTDLTPDCLTLQFRGLSACEDCPKKNTQNCGGGETLKRLLEG